MTAFAWVPLKYYFEEEKKNGQLFHCNCYAENESSNETTERFNFITILFSVSVC